MNRKLFVVYIMALAVALSGCGGGSSSSGAGRAAAFAGTYNGTGTIELTTGRGTETGMIGVQVVISEQGNVVTDPNSGFSGVGSLDGNQFTVAIPARLLNEPGLQCTGAIIITGTVSGDTIQGTFTSSGFVCNGQAGQVNGTFQAVRITPSAAPLQRHGLSIEESLRKALH